MDSKRRYVLDANVFLEYMFGRKFQDVAKGLIAKAISGENELMIPSLALDEISEVLCGNMDDLYKVTIHLRFLEKLVLEGWLKVIIPTSRVRIHAIKMARQGHRKSGYPEFTDCLYHSLALLNNAVFITNDKRHFAKVRDAGNISLLSELAINND